MGGHSHDRVERSVELGHTYKAHDILYSVRASFVHGRPCGDVLLYERFWQFIERDVA